MAKIIYAVNGEGWGHALRSKVVIEHLLEKKHDVVIVTSGKAYEFFKKQYDDVYDIHHYHIVYENNAVNHFKTVISNLKKSPKGVPKTMYRLFKLLYSWEPDLVITDFEPFSDFLSKFFLIPVIAIDNINVMVKGDVEVDKKHIVDYILAQIVARAFVLSARKYILTTFFYPELKKPHNTVFVPPAIRSQVLDAKPKKGKHLLIYQTSASNKAMLKELKKTDEKYIIYGFNISKKDKNIQFRKFSEQGIVNDMADAKAVIVNGGFTVVSEALYLKKPLLSIPVKKQFEQILNAKYIEKLGYGMYASRLTARKLEEFISLIPKYNHNLRYYKQYRNKKLYKEVDKTIRELLKEKSIGKTLRQMKKDLNKKVIWYYSTIKKLISSAFPLSSFPLLCL